MTQSQRLALRASEIRRRLAEISGTEEFNDELRAEASTLRTEMQDVETRYQCAVESEDVPAESRASSTAAGAGESRELAEIRGQVELRNYLGAALERRSLSGPESELNAALQIPMDRFPLELLAPEVRATTNTDAGATQGSWVDRLFSETHAMRLGVTFESVAPGVAAFPVTSAGASAAQRGRSEPAADATWTVAVSELKPSRNSTRAIFNEEDSLRLPGLEPALRRDLGMALAEGIDRTIFLGDGDANENTADIVGLTTATGVSEITLTQTDKTKGEEVVQRFVSLVDGVHATMESELSICMSAGANALFRANWGNNQADDSRTIAQVMSEAGLTWSVRGGIDTDTAASDWGAFIGRMRGIRGAGIVPVWNSAKLIRDEYSGAAKGEVALTLATYWNFGLPRASNFARLKFVA